MITDNSLCIIGTFGQPHGIKGEIAATIDDSIDPEQLRCIVLDIDGINVPFFIEGCRTKSATTVLLTIDGITDEIQASDFVGKTIYALRSDLPDENSDEADGFFAEDLIGFTVDDTTGKLSGTIDDVDDTTVNMLFVVSTSQGNRLIPVADELIAAIDPETRHITFDLPQGLLEL